MSTNNIVYKCPKCGSEGAHRVITRGPHYTLVCGNCGKYIKHIKKNEIDKLDKRTTEEIEPCGLDCIVINEDGQIL